MLAGRAATEIPIRDDNISCLHFFYELRVSIFHAMFGQQCRIRRVEIPGGNDRIRINVGSKYPGFPSKLHG
jgi:hypothetical protein